MSISKFVENLDVEQLLYAKSEIEARLARYKAAKQIKFASLVYAGIRHCWIDSRDKEGWVLLEKEYNEAAKKQFPLAVKWCSGEFANSSVRKELPQIEFDTVSSLEYDSWLSESLNPEFKRENDKEV